MQIQVIWFLIGDWENLQEEFFLWAQDLMASSSLMPFPQHDPSAHKHFLHNLVLGHVSEYFQVVHVLTPFFFALMSFDTTSTHSILYHELDGLFMLFLKDYKPNQDFELSFDSFKLTFKCMLYLFASGISRMVFEHLQGYFHPNVFASGFPQLFQLCFHIAQGHNLCQIA